MKAYSFGTFLVDDSNREALEACRDIANLRPVGPFPLVLVGEKGCGKTHLLYSIVNRVRSSLAQTGLAYVTARDFPAPVRVLIEDPSPVERAQSAILIVNNLDQFDDLIEELKAIVRIFLDNEHAVVLASNLHPARLHNITDGLRALIESGRVVTIAPQSAQVRVELLRKQARKESEELIGRQQEEIQNLQERIEELEQTARAVPAPADGAGDAVARERIEALALELEQARREAEEAQEELEHSEGERALLQADAQDARKLRKVCADLKETADALREQQTLQQTRIAELETALAEARADHHRACEEAQGLVNRAETLLKQIAENRNQFRVKEDQYTRRIAELEAALENHGAGPDDHEDFDALRSEVDDANRDRDRLSALLEEMERALSVARAQVDEAAGQATRAEAKVTALRNENDTLRADFEQARAEQSDLLDSLEKAHEELAKAREEISQQAEEMGLVCRRTSSHLAQADALVEAVEQENAELLEELEQLRAAFDSNCDVVTELSRIQHEMLEMARKASELAECFADVAYETDDEAQETDGGGDEPGEPQAHESVGNRDDSRIQPDVQAYTAASRLELVDIEADDETPPEESSARLDAVIRLLENETASGGRDTFSEDSAERTGEAGVS